MRVFSAALATETNTFGPMPTDITSFHERTYFRSSEHPDAMQMHSGPLWAARQIGRPRGWTLIEGLVAAAVPNGIVTRAAYESLRDELLDDLRRALPVDMVLLGLHGAMVADGYDDCEGDLLACVRDIVGADTVIGATLDSHTHLSERMTQSADLLIWWKEYPHTDILDRALELVELCAAAHAKQIVPQAAVVDTGMIVQLHTTRSPARDFVARAKALEQRDDVLSVSIVHGFAWGDTPDMGTKVVVYTDARIDRDGSTGRELARAFADELWNAREQFEPPLPDVDRALDLAIDTPGTVVLADGADNAGGGAPSDSTFVLRRLFERKLTDACVGPLWDPGAVRLAFGAGEGATLPLRVGGKIGPLSGDPLDATWTVRALKRDMVMSGLAGTPARLGDCALIESAGVEVVISSLRSQAFSVDLFTQLGCDPATRRFVVVKSSQHFYASYAPIASRVIYMAVRGVVAHDISTLPYRKIARPKWPLDR
ncbi:M81 family metallopeptidase [Paraburkholderia antibiotica]|uniref:Microcystinase C n=1 Tax=Paraburkholderia antibiotica TaxID=2728839 RepID=A0A7X9X327_9BURK|nr:M81 family metallopeptidase [Paraburkholderia antibiotica]NML30515.1 M81 family metallopeptidase [Paraburkholderia antibiotica]